MKPARIVTVFCIALTSMGLALPQSSAATKTRPQSKGAELRVFTLDPQLLAQTRARAMAGDRELASTLGRLKRNADQAVEAGVYSVTTVNKPRPSGDKHDYVSLATYYWPDPNSPNGLPYIAHDGKANPALKEYCSPVMKSMAQQGMSCALAYYFSGNEHYAGHAAKIFRTWFLDPATRMNPHLRYAQFVPGRDDGRPIGIIDSHVLTDVVDAAGMLAGSRSWSAEDQKGLEKWFGEYLEWLLTSTNGQKEAAARNNHAVWFDVQATSFALFVGRNDVAKRILEEARSRRIATQIEPDGSMPLELKRTKSFDYSIFNVDAFFTLATEGQNAGVDLWNYQTPDGRSIRKALDFMLPYTVGGKPWEHEQINKFSADAMFPLLRRAAIAYHDPRYEAMITKLPPKDYAADRVTLLYPRTAVQSQRGR